MHQKNKILAISALLCLTLLLSSCLFPESFKSSVEIKRNGDFSFSYDGTLTFLIARVEEVQSGTLSPETRQALKVLEKKMSQDKAFKKVEYLGHSKYRVIYRKEGKLDKPFYFVGSDVKLFSIIPKPGGLVEIKGIGLGKKDINELKELKLKIDGELNVKTDGEVIEQNATSTPSLFGLWGGYQWKITSLNAAQPKMLIKIN